jgi:argininosuccinate synthase
MIQQTAITLAELYETDETAWLEAMADLIQQGRWSDLDYAHLQEYLTDMARRDRREVTSRLTVLLTHLLKWTHQTEKRSRSWRGTIIEQRQELADLVGQGVLRKHAEEILAQVYARAVERVSGETGLSTESFPASCPYSLDQLISADLTAD